MLIDELGVRPAEILVREWVRNLAVPPLGSEADLLDAIEAGTCGIGIVSSQAWAAQGLDADDRGIVGLTPDRAFASIEGIAVVRHAHHPEAANRLVAWLLADAQQSRHSEATFMLPIDTLPEMAPTFNDDWRALNRWRIINREVSVAGWRDEEAILLAERARYP